MEDGVREATVLEPLAPLRTAVILFRDNSRGGKDAYTDPLLEEHDAVESIAVLQHQDLLTPQIISDVLESHASSTPFAALVFTSQNAVQALNRALAECTAVGEKKKRWDRLISLPIFVVGGATGSLCRSTLLRHLPRVDVRGERAGGARAMLPEIAEFCQQYRSQNRGAKPRLVFFCGDQRRNTLPDGLRHSDAADLVEVISYTTTARDSNATRRDLIEAIAKIKAACWAKHRAARALASEGRLAATVNCDILVWMVVFSPSGVRVVAPLLAALESEHVLHAGGDSAWSDLPVTSAAAAYYGLAAIGVTTRDELVAQQVRQPIVLAKEPSAQGIRSALRK